MKNTTSIATMKVAQHSKNQVAPNQSKLGKFSNWWKTKAEPWLAKAMNEFNALIAKIRLPKLSTILVLAILVYMANNGALEDMPNAKWLVECSVRLVECSVRLIEWVFGAFRWFVEMFVGMLESKFIDTIDIFNIFDTLSNFMKQIFAM